MFKKINKLSLFFHIFIPLIIGAIGALLGGSMDIYTKLNLPSFAPPPIVFPIVWNILYILMGISSYMVFHTDTQDNTQKTAKWIYALQLIINSLWTMIFFKFKLFLFAFWWLLLLILFVSTMIFLFFKINKTAALLQIPYFVWIVFACILNYCIYMLN